MVKILLPLFLLTGNLLMAQSKKTLDHSIYDGWKSAGERAISNDGNYIVYAINPQEGDGETVIQNIKTGYKKNIARGYNAVITEDNRYVMLKIKPVFQDTRQAKIKKKKPEDMPRDSMVLVLLGT
ncbi:MAG: S9 family peptidase, partial [Ferruginibacter sp.]